jgi:predicted nucleic acid-binding protein
MLDTDMASYIIKGRAPAIDANLASIQPSMICLSIITRAELLYRIKHLPADRPAGAVLMTNNTRHFERIDAPLLLANWAEPAAGR